MYIATKILLSYFATMSTPTGAPDLCELEVPEGALMPCQPHRTPAPVYDDDVCCDDTTCFTPNVDGSCEPKETRHYCEFGEVSSRGLVNCLFEIDDYCDKFPCPSEPPPEFDWYPPEATLCCDPWGNCFDIGAFHEGDCYFEIVFCANPVSNPDGTVGCADWD